MSKAKRSIWALIGKILWFFISLVLKVIAALGSRWARKRLDKHDRKSGSGRAQRILRPSRR